MRGGLVDYRLNEPRPPGRRISWNPRTENVRRVQIVDPSQVGLTSMFAALLRPLAQKLGWGLPNFGSVCSQLEVLETGLDLRVWRRQGSCSGT